MQQRLENELHGKPLETSSVEQLQALRELIGDKTKYARGSDLDLAWNKADKSLTIMHDGQQLGQLRNCNKVARSLFGTLTSDCTFGISLLFVCDCVIAMYLDEHSNASTIRDDFLKGVWQALPSPKEYSKE